ncbi:MarR family transcriptional regulator [Streptomyces abyssalis]|uniref:MarR family transcriptional regulator n=1 Tax=Streptomyces abyssalis TaxID=933944 RepID=A0A1E7JJ12_9ACTN|nr:MarR family transcriptional regulator [Streptomyces abyssalis]OEU86443.1 MarR family transcriptional regulator [Streptomyces abyssalis]OEU92438.1 MarR family transcriptional regulator [Streptomyces abyssalis]OEV26506.1 MarR family transcriptional regulator [Streptomyces nanshensis]
MGDSRPRPVQPPQRGPSGRGSREAAEVTAEVIELLEVLWEKGRDAASTSPVSASQLRVLYCLDREDGMNLRTLGESLGSAPSSVSRLCDRLQALGFLERRPSSVSRRELELHLTRQGKDYLRGLRLRREESLTATIAAMPPKARTALLEGLTGFRDVAEELIPQRRLTVQKQTGKPA